MIREIEQRDALLLRRERFGLAGTFGRLQNMEVHNLSAYLQKLAVLVDFSLHSIVLDVIAITNGTNQSLRVNRF